MMNLYELKQLENMLEKYKSTTKDKYERQSIQHTIDSVIVDIDNELEKIKAHFDDMSMVFLNRYRADKQERIIEACKEAHRENSEKLEKLLYPNLSFKFDNTGNIQLTKKY